MSQIFEDGGKNAHKKEMESMLEEMTTEEYKEEWYRWVVVVLVAFMLLINGLANNAIVPIASKIALVYDLTSTYVNSPIVASLLVYSVMNIPANYVMDKMGLRVSFLIGSALYTLGLLMYALINQGFFFVLIGSMVIALGQPFIINSPAKAATYWFNSQNRTFATSLMIATNLISIGVSFMSPTIFVGESSVGDSAKDQIFYLYSVYFLLAAVGFVLVFLFMRKQPKNLPSLGAETKKSDFKESVQILKKDRNLWKFYAAYIFTYGTMLGLGSEANLLFKPYGFTDIQIGICAVTMLVMGVAGSIILSLYIKKTNNYKRALRSIVVMGMIVIVSLVIWLSVSAALGITIVLVGFLGFATSPIITLCYDLGCELAFPMGEAQVTGLLNGSSLFFTFIVTLVISAAVGFGQRSKSFTVMLIFLSFMVVGGILFWQVEIKLKRKDLEKGKIDEGVESERVEDLIRSHHEHHVQELEMQQRASEDPESPDKLHRAPLNDEMQVQKDFSTLVEDKASI